MDSDFSSASHEELAYGPVALETLKWSLISSTGFLSAVICTYLILKFLVKTRGDRQPGDFGKFLVLVELIDSIPEASLLAALTAAHEIKWSFALSLMFLNIANTLASSMDFLATSDDPQIHRFVYCTLYFSVGTMTYSIPTQVFALFKLKYEEGERNIAQELVLVLATVVGAALIAGLMWFEEKILGHQKPRLEVQHERLQEVIETENEEKNKNLTLRTSIRKSLRVSLRTLNNSGPRRPAALADSAGSLRKTTAPPATLRTQTASLLREREEEEESEDSEGLDSSGDGFSPLPSSLSGEPRNIALELQSVNKKIQGSEQVLAVSGMFMKLLENPDTSHVTSGFLQVIGMEHIIKSLGSEFELDTIMPEVEEASLERRTLKLFGFMLGISTFAAVVAIGFSALAVTLNGTQSLTFVDSFFEGFSGGAFLATIAGTMMFRLHSAANGSAWGTEPLKIFGLSLFVTGLMFVFLLDTLVPSEEGGASSLSHDL